MAQARRHGADPRLPIDAVASRAHPVSLRAVLLALHLRGGGTPWCHERLLARHQTHPALPPAAPRRLRSGALRTTRGTTRHSGDCADAHRGSPAERPVSAEADVTTERGKDGT